MDIVWGSAVILLHQISKTRQTTMNKIIIATVQGGYFCVINIQNELKEILNELCTLSDIAHTGRMRHLPNVTLSLTYAGDEIKFYTLHKTTRTLIENDLRNIDPFDIEYYALPEDLRSSLASKGLYESFKFINNLGDMSNIREVATSKLILEIENNSLIIKAWLNSSVMIESDSLSIDDLV